MTENTQKKLFEKEFPNIKVTRIEIQKGGNK